jgi:hypothetical protein
VVKSGNIKKRGGYMGIRGFKEKFIERIAIVVQGFGLELIQQQSYANAGKLFVQAEKDFESLAVITYDFQVDNMTLTLSAKGKPIVMDRQKHRTDGYVKWYMDITNHAEINEFFDKLRAALPQKKAETKKEKSKGATK